MGTTFFLNSGEAYEQGTKASDLEEEDKVVYKTLSVLTGRRKYILDAIIKGGAITTREARKCGIIDSVSEFKSKYIISKPKNTVQTNNSGEQKSELQQTNVPATTPQTRGRRKSTNK